MAMHTLMFIKAYFEIHPMIRDLTYSALGIGKKEAEKTLA
jgi:hypothetical protein